VSKKEKKKEIWKKEKKKMKGYIKELEKRMEDLEINRDSEIERGMERVGESGGIEKRLKETEKKLKIKEREERKSNLIIKKLKVREGKRREAVEEIAEEIGAKVKVKEVRKFAGDKEKGREIEQQYYRSIFV
jgi:hypothetical protein